MMNITNLSNSLLAHFGVKPFHPTIPQADELLKGRRKVCVFLYDGMGQYVLGKHPVAGKPFLDNQKFVIESTNPSTTVAATTSFLTGKSPIETGWLGWALPIFKPEEPIECFTDLNFVDGRKMGEGLLPKECPLVYIDELMRDAGRKASIMYQYGVGGRFDGPKTFPDAIPLATRFFQEGGEFLYIYFNQPDGLLHHRGLESQEVDDCIRLAGEVVEEFAKANPDVLTIVIADHGHLPTRYIDLADHPDVLDCLRAPISLEFRTCSFFVKKEKEEEFLGLMKSKFPQIRLISRETALETHYFGEGEPNPKAVGFLGDYIGITQDETAFYDSKTIHTQMKLLSHHAGSTPMEKNIVVSVWNEWSSYR